MATAAVPPSPCVVFDLDGTLTPDGGAGKAPVVAGARVVLAAPADPRALGA